MAWKCVVTNAGAAMLASYAAGDHTLSIDGATVGSGVIDEINLRVATALTSEKDEASIIDATAITGGTKFKIEVGPASAEVGAYTAHQIGLWASLDEGTSTLMVLAQDSVDGVGVPLASAQPEFAFALYITVAVGNTGSITVNIDDTAFVSMGTLLEKLALKVDTSSIANNLTTTAEGKVLDARQGKALNDAISGVNTALAGKADASSVYTKSQVDSALGGKAPVNSPTFTGTPSGPTAAAGTNNTQLATTAFVQTAISNHVTALSLTASAASWSSAEPPTLTLTAAGVTASNDIIVGIGGSLTDEQHEAVKEAEIVCTAQGADSITLTAFGTVPTVDIPVKVLILS